MHVVLKRRLAYGHAVGKNALPVRMLFENNNKNLFCIHVVLKGRFACVHAARKNVFSVCVLFQKRLA